MGGTTCIRGADWVVAWDDAAAGHHYLRNADLAFSGNTIDFVGRNFTGPTDVEIDGAGLMVMPGLISLHGHPTSQLMGRGILEELGNPRLHMTALYDLGPLWRGDGDAALAGAEACYAELLRSGVTTAVDFARPAPAGWIELMARSGMRIYAAPSFRDALWVVSHGSRVDYDWDEARGARAFEAALALVEDARAHPCGRLGGMVSPAHGDTYTDQTLQNAMSVARDKGLPWQTHLSQTVIEFQETVRRTGMTPIQRMDRLGVLCGNATIVHGIFTDQHSWTNWHTRDDLAILATTGTTLVQCPVAMERIGHRLESFGGYRRAGINLALGTDVQPANMLEEMRAAMINSRTASGNIADATAADAFNATTIGGAAALLRDDNGRLGQGMRADLVLVDLTGPAMRPLRDPLRNLIYTAADRAIRHVYVDGNQMVEHGRVLTLDEAAALTRLETAQAEADENVSGIEPDGHDGREVSPLVFPEAAP